MDHLTVYLNGSGSFMKCGIVSKMMITINRCGDNEEHRIEPTRVAVIFVCQWFIIHSKLKKVAKRHLQHV